ncbi:MAG: hypothetical protein ACNA8H_12390 [Anaerolineales bacterium]
MHLFNGDDYTPQRDNKRLLSQLERVKLVMSDGKWHTLAGIATTTGDPAPSVSAQLRHLRKPRFGGHTIAKQHLNAGLYIYRMEPSC